MEITVYSMSSANNPTMGTVLTTLADPTIIKTSDKITGIIISITKSQVIIQIPNVGLVMVRGKELYNEEYLAKLKLGEEIEVAVIDLDNEQGYIEGSFRAIGRDRIWADITAAFENKDTVPAKIRDANRGGFLIKVHGIDGFLPASLLSPTHSFKSSGVDEKSVASKMKKYVGQTFNVKLVNISPENDSIIASEKAVSDEISQAKMQKYKAGDTIEGKIVGIVDFGLFVRFDEDLEGLVHISEISWKKIENPYKEYKIGQSIKAKVADIDKENRINLSIKQLLPNPWNEFVKDVKIGDEFKGKVNKIASYGAIIVNEDDIQGLCHISQISEQTIDSPAKIHEFLKPGQSYSFVVLSIEPGERLYLTRLPLDTATAIQDKISDKQTAFNEVRETKKAVREPRAAKVTPSKDGVEVE